MPGLVDKEEIPRPSLRDAVVKKGKQKDDVSTETEMVS
jgi:hypothetical protein